MEGFDSFYPAICYKMETGPIIEFDFKLRQTAVKSVEPKQYICFISNLSNKSSVSKENCL